VTGQQCYEFGAYRVDPAQCRLLRGETHVSLPPKAFDLLLILVRNPNRMLSKRELIEALWPDTFVDDANLTQHVFTLRRALGSQLGGDAYIETVPRRGYIFHAAAREATESAARAESTQQRPVIVDGERKQATVLNCAVINAGVLAERLGPARLETVMTELTGMIAQATLRYEGMLRRTRPDAFEVVFGATLVHEDDPWRAVLTAFATHRGAAALSPAEASDEETPVMSIGIATGPVVITRRVDDRGVEYAAVGETMRIAGLLQQLAEPGTILINDASRRAVEGYVALGPPLEIGGAAAFLVIGAPPARVTRTPRLMRPLEPFIGRVHELGLLANLATQMRSGRGQVAGVVGEPGIGKSRLLLEFIKAAPDLTALEARCVSYGSLVPYLPLADLLRAYCGVKETDSAEEVARAVRTVAAAAALPTDADTWLLRLLGVGETVNDTVSPEAIKARTFDVLKALFLHAATLRPLVIVVEDIHWIDRTSEEFLGMLVERIVAARVLIIVTFRPRYQMPWRDRSYVTQITLTPLATAEGKALIGAVARKVSIPPHVSAAIVAKADGNPFFLEELTRAVLEHGPEHGVPDTVHGVIMARIDRLPDAAKQLLQTAAVLGREVPLGVLSRVSSGIRDIATALEELCRLEFFYQQAGGDEPVFVFRHALTQDVAYDSLLARRRRDLHLQAARALEELHAGRLDEMTAMLAYHYARTDMVDAAVTWLIRAADRAARVYANAEAILHLDLARRRLDSLPESPDRYRREVEVGLKHAHSLYFLGRWQESVEILRPHHVYLVRLNDSGLTATYSFWLAHMYTRLGDQRQAAEHANRAIAAGTRAGDWATVGKAHGVLALDAHWSGKTHDGVVHGEEAVRLLTAHADQRWWLGMAHFYLAMNHVVTGDFHSALTEAGHAHAIGEQIDDPRLQTYAGFMEAWVEASRGNCDAAMTVCQHSLEQAPDRVSHAFASTILGYALLEAGHHDTARMRLEPLVGEFESFGFPQWQGWAAVLTAETYRLDGAVDIAASFVERGLTVALQTQYWYAVGFGERIAARIAHDRGRLAESSTAFGQALRTFARIGARFEESRTRQEAKTPPRAPVTCPTRPT
jgi:DNA-binding winged helix-turn-helix (wHTH) protein/tetratricopeptide (TPR) repeat protein